MTRELPSDETQDKSKLLGLSINRPIENRLRVLRCMNCILARPIPDDEPHFTRPQLEQCAGQAALGLIRHASRQGWVTQEPIPSTSPIRGPKTRFVPTTKGLEEFFDPRPDPSCDRTYAQGVYRGMFPADLRVLNRLANPVPPEEGSALDQIGSMQQLTELPLSRIRQAFDFFTRTGLARSISDQGPDPSHPDDIVLTDLGTEVAGYLKPAHFEKQKRQASAEKEAKAGDEDTFELPAAITAIIAERYPDERLAGFAALEVTTCIRDRLLHVVVPGNSSESTPRLEFTQTAARHLGKDGQWAIAHGLDLELLLYGTATSEKEMRVGLGVPADVELMDYIDATYFYPVMTALEESNQSSSSENPSPTTPGK